jgi:hypothetical protein
MKKTAHTILVAAATAVIILSTQALWHHFHPPTVQAKGEHPRMPLPSQQAAEAKQAATDFFNAMANGDWNKVAKYWPSGAGKSMNDVFTPKNKDLVAGRQVTSIGEPYRQGGLILVPYEVQFKGGGTQSNDLRLQKKSDGQWIWTGGF